MRKVDFVIIGAGIVGLTIARELKARFPKQKILVLEKEKQMGLHSSGRNSGVLHSGIYYPVNSIKAKICVEGAKSMAEYCLDRKLPLNAIGKILVPTSVDDAPQLDLLQERAKSNGVKVERVDAALLKSIEPEARSATGSALFVPSTSVGNPIAVINMIADEVIKLGVDLCYNTKVVGVNAAQNHLTLNNNDIIAYGHVVNCAGLHADTVAHLFGVGQQYTLLPFKGLYWKLRPDSGLKINHLIYPVPDLRVPFLGVHTTTTSDGVVYLGPTATPAFGRENYKGLNGVSVSEGAKISRILLSQAISGKDGFRRLAVQESGRYFKPWFARAARKILPRLRNSHLQACDKLGIRAQMYDRMEGKLVNDFLVEKGASSTHILNAISPAWTCAFPFASFVIDNYVLSHKP